MKRSQTASGRTDQRQKNPPLPPSPQDDREIHEPVTEKPRINAYVLTLVPLYLFTGIFVLCPLIYMVILSFMTRSESFNVEAIFTLKNYMAIFDPIYLNTFVQSIKLALISTSLVILIGYPCGYYMAQLSEKGKRLSMMMIMIPFWTSSLIRLYGWIIIFRANGILDKFLMTLHLTDTPLKLLYTYPAVVVGMVYTLLPFMIFSVYSSAEKLDFSLVEASRDLGAGSARTFFSVSFPLTLPGLLSGVVLTFVPSMGLFFLADILGGNKIVLIGTVIQEQLTKARNWPFAAALSVALMLLTSLFIFLYRRITKTGELEGLV